jgi:hypothetical protein
MNMKKQIVKTKKPKNNFKLEKIHSLGTTISIQDNPTSKSILINFNTYKKSNGGVDTRTIYDGIEESDNMDEIWLDSQKGKLVGIQIMLFKPWRDRCKKPL